MKISTIFNGISIEANFTGKLNVLEGNSGTGKTLLMKAIKLYCLSNNIQYRHLDYNNKNDTVEQLVSYCNKAQIITIDNADLFISDELLECLCKTAKLIVISLKQTQLISMDKTHTYIVHYENNHLSLEEF